MHAVIHYDAPVLSGGHPKQNDHRVAKVMKIQIILINSITRADTAK